MRPTCFHTWQQAEKKAREAAVTLQAELAKPGAAPPDEMFARLCLLRRRASDALRELTRNYADESERLRRMTPQAGRAPRRRR